jgi:hypothetical protein
LRDGLFGRKRRGWISGWKNVRSFKRNISERYKFTWVHPVRKRRWNTFDFHLTSWMRAINYCFRVYEMHLAYHLAWCLFNLKRASFFWVSKLQVFSVLVWEKNLQDYNNKNSVRFWGRLHLPFDGATITIKCVIFTHCFLNWLAGFWNIALNDFYLNTPV